MNSDSIEDNHSVEPASNGSARDLSHEGKYSDITHLCRISRK